MRRGSSTSDAGAKIVASIADFHDQRPHSAPGSLTPAAYAATWTATDDLLRTTDEFR